MANQTAPTKGNLMNTKKSLALAKMGYELMDKKRNILIREMMNLIDKANAIQGKIDNAYEEAYLALQTGEDLSYYGIHYYARPYAEVNRDRWHMGAERRIDQVNIWVVSPEQWSELLKRYDYVYVLNADEYLQETYGDMTDKAFEPRTIYKVLNEDGKVRLVSSGIDLYN